MGCGVGREGDHDGGWAGGGGNTLLWPQALLRSSPDLLKEYTLKLIFLKVLLSK